MPEVRSSVVHPRLQPDGLPCGAFRQPDQNVLWRVWAPAASTVELILSKTAGQPEAVLLSPEGGGYWFCRLSGIAEGQRYLYRLGGTADFPDPASRWQPDGVNAPSATFFPEDFDWHDSDWCGLHREALVIYELHVGTFTDAGTFDAIIPRLPALRELGVTAIELMPVAQFPGNRGWGYDGVHPFAVQNSYGGPRGLQRLVDAAHAAGLAVLLDVVYNHVGPEGNYLSQFGPYFTDRYHTPWGSAVNFDGTGCDGVRAFVLQNALQWVRDFHIDGLRLDAVHEIYDFGARHILRDLKQAVEEEARALGRTVLVIAESDLNDVRLLDPVSRGGDGLDAQWSDDFHHSVHALLTGERQGYYSDFGRTSQLVKALRQTFVYDGSYSESRGRKHGAPAGAHPGDAFVVCIQNHDQVGNRAAGERLSTLVSSAQQRLAAGLLLLSPHVPLLFMGEEYGERHPFPYFCSFFDPTLIEAVRVGRTREFADFRWQEHAVPDPQAESTFQSAKLSWSWQQDAHQTGLRQLYTDLLAARRHWPALRNFVDRTVELAGIESRLLILKRTAEPSDRGTLTAIFNLGDQPQTLDELPEYGINVEGMLLLKSEDARYGGAGGLAEETHEAHVIDPWEFQVFGPAQWKNGREEFER